MSPVDDTDENSGVESDTDLARVLRAAGHRAQPSEEMTSEVRAAVHAEWRAAVNERHSRRRRWISFAAAAGVVVLITGVWAVQTTFTGTGIVLASVDRVTGTVRAGHGWFVPERTVHPGDVLRQGDRLVTDSAGGSALRLEGGTSIRLDAATRVDFVDLQRMRIAAGAAYIDTGETSAHPARPLNVATPLGVVRHLGTQYEIRLSADILLVSVREGRVELTGPDGIVRTGGSGERLTLHADGQLERTAIKPDAAEWQWASALAAPFAIENRSLADFLSWVARETGRELVYTTPETAAEAQRVMLRGSVANLAPDDALSAVLSTTRLRSVVSGGRISIVIE